MKNLSKETAAELAVKMVILDAIEKGHTTINELTGYMKFETFKKAALNYQNLILNEKF